MQIKLTHIAPLLAAGAAAVAISAAPTATAEATIVQSPGNAQITAQPAAWLRSRPPSCSSHSAGIWAACCSTTAAPAATAKC